MEVAAHTPLWYPSIGVAFQPDEPIAFIDGYKTIDFYRNYDDPCRINVEAVAEFAVCDERKAQRAIPETTVDISAKCSELWLDNLNMIDEYSMSHYRDSAPFYEAPVIPEYQPELPRRFSRSITLVGFSYFTQVIGNLISVGLSIYDAFKDTNLDLEHAFYDYIEAHGQERLIVAQGLSAHRSSIEAFIDHACEVNIADSEHRLEIAAKDIIRRYTDRVVDESISLSFGEFPRNLNFLDSILKLCEAQATNTKKFCLSSIYANKIAFKFMGSMINNVTDSERTLAHKLVIEMPIQASTMRHNDFYSIINLGAWSQEFFKLDLPDSIISASGNIFELDFSICHNRFCPMGALKINKHSKCIKNLFKNNSLEECTPEFTNAPSVCKIRRIGNSTIVQAESATALLDGANGPVTHRLNRENALFSLPGKLLCSQDDQFSETYVLPSLTSVYDNSGIGATEQISVRRPNLYALNATLSRSLLIEKRLLDLEKSEDKILIFKRDFPILPVILICGGLFSFFVVCFVIRGALALTAHKLWLKLREPFNFELSKAVRGRTEKCAMLKTHSVVEIEGEFSAVANEESEN